VTRAAARTLGGAGAARTSIGGEPATEALDGKKRRAALAVWVVQSRTIVGFPAPAPAEYFIDVRPARCVSALHVLTFTRDTRFARVVAAVCAERGFVVTRLDSLGLLPRSLGAGSGPSVLLIDADDALADGLRTASTVSAVHPDVAIVLAADRPRARSEGEFRLVDRRSEANVIVDELELGHIGIPAYVVDRLHQPSAENAQRLRRV
jgi:hypothetical protein